jgi:hypothetical protein
MCQHQPRCPEPWEPDRLAARVVADRPEQGWSLLCNGVILFEDDSEMVIASTTAHKARENCRYVRTLLARKQPEFSRALAAAERELARQGGCLPERLVWRLRDWADERTKVLLAATRAA